MPGRLTRTVIQAFPSFRGRTKLPTYSAPGDRTMTSPGCAESSAACRSPPGGTGLTPGRSGTDPHTTTLARRPAHQPLSLLMEVFGVPGARGPRTCAARAQPPGDPKEFTSISARARRSSEVLCQPTPSTPRWRRAAPSAKIPEHVGQKFCWHPVRGTSIHMPRKVGNQFPFSAELRRDTQSRWRDPCIMWATRVTHPRACS